LACSGDSLGTKITSLEMLLGFASLNHRGAVGVGESSNDLDRCALTFPVHQFDRGENFGSIGVFWEELVRIRLIFELRHDLGSWSPSPSTSKLTSTSTSTNSIFILYYNILLIVASSISLSLTLNFGMTYDAPSSQPVPVSR
jgi:hypothetical protein